MTKKRSLAISGSVLTILTGLAFFTMPQPFNFIIMLALSGPNSVSIWGLFR